MHASGVGRYPWLTALVRRRSSGSPPHHLYPGGVASLPDHFQGAPVGRDPVSREVLSEHQRERVLVAATKVFAKRGYEGTSVDDLFAAGKVGVSNFYSLFEGKEDCFLTVFDRVVLSTRTRIAAAASGAEDWAGRTYLGLRGLLEAFVADPLAARLALVEAQSAGEKAIARYNAQMDVAIAWLQGARNLYPSAQQLPPRFEQATVLGLAFYLQQCLLDSKRHGLEELLGETAGLALEPLVGPRELERLKG